MKKWLFGLLFLLATFAVSAQTHKIEQDGNYIVLTEIATNEIELEIPKKDIRFKISRGRVYFYDVQTSTKTAEGKRAGYLVTDLRDEGTLSLFTEATLKTFFRAHTGFNSGGGVTSGQTAAQVNAAITASQAPQDALIATKADASDLANYKTIATQDATDAAQDLVIAGKAETTDLANYQTIAAQTTVDAAQNVQIANKLEAANLVPYRTATDQDAIDNAQNTNIATKVNLSDKANAGEITAGTADKWVDALELRAALDAQNVTGDFIGSSATFATLPTVSPTKTAANGDWSTLTADDGGNLRGVYLYDGTNYNFAFSLGSNILDIIDSTIPSTDGSYSTTGLLSVENLDQHFLSRLKSTLFKVNGGSFDTTPFDFPDNMAFAIHNTSNTTVTSINWDTGRSSIANIDIVGLGTTLTSTNGTYALQPSSWALLEFQSGTLQISVTENPRVFQYNDLAEAQADNSSKPYNAIIMIGDGGGVWIKIVGNNNAFDETDLITWSQVSGGNSSGGVIAELMPVQHFQDNTSNVVADLGNLEVGKYRYNVSNMVWSSTVGQMGARVNVLNATSSIVESRQTRIGNSHSTSVWQTLPNIVLDFEVTVPQNYTLQLEGINTNGQSFRSIEGVKFTSSDVVAKDAVIEVEDSEFILIDVDALTNTFYPFSTGENWAQIKANYDNLRFDINVSDSGTSNVTPQTVFIDPSKLELYASNSGWDIIEANGVFVDVTIPVDTDLGLTYLQTSGDSPGNGRMQFKVTGIKKRATVVRPEDVRAFASIETVTATTTTFNIPSGFTNPVITASSDTGDVRVNIINSTEFTIQIIDSAGTIRSGDVHIHILESTGNL